MQRIVAATDGSESANRAVIAAAKLAVAVAGDLHIVHVSGDLPSGGMEEVKRSPSLEKALGDILNQHARRILLAAEDRARNSGASKVHTWQLWGDAAEKILEFIERERMDTLVVGRRGRGRLAGLLLGSVSQKLTSLAPCTVVVVP
jgi:nucleotide-binding universal stress UspA family protein